MFVNKYTDYKMKRELRCYETKFIGDTTFYDYWDLRSHPLYILADKKQDKPYLKFDEVYFANSIKVSSLGDISRVLREILWTSEPRYWKHISRTIQSIINTALIEKLLP